MLKTRLLRRVLATVLALVLVWLVGGYFVLVHPKLDKPTRVDAVLVLGPPQVDGRVDEAIALAHAAYAKTVVVSTPSGLRYGLRRTCADTDAGIEVICFRPDPPTTQGEAQEIGRLAKDRGWTSILVVTSTYHISRARLIVNRCMDGTVGMLAAPGKPGLRKWAYEYLYQTGAYLKAFVNPNC